MDEILRMLVALQTHGAFGLSTPADWFLGMPVLEPLPDTVADMQKRMATRNKNTQTWYLTFRDLPELKIYEKLTKKKR